MTALDVIVPRATSARRSRGGVTCQGQRRTRRNLHRKHTQMRAVGDAETLSARAEVVRLARGKLAQRAEGAVQWGLPHAGR
jgi:hypothetical protein